MYSGMVRAWKTPGSELDAGDHELVVQHLVRDLFVALRVSELAAEGAPAGVLGDEVDAADAVRLLGVHPLFELFAGRDERGNLVARVEVLSLPVHLVRDEGLI